MPGRAATTSWTVIARFVGLRWANSAGRVHAGGLEQVAVLRPDARDPHKIDLVDPVADELAADLGRLRDPVAAARLRPGTEQVVGRPDADPGELLGVGGTDPLDVLDVHVMGGVRLRRRLSPRRPRGAATALGAIVSATTGCCDRDRRRGDDRRRGGLGRRCVRPAPRSRPLQPNAALTSPVLRYQRITAGMSAIAKPTPVPGNWKNARTASNRAMPAMIIANRRAHG